MPGPGRLTSVDRFAPTSLTFACAVKGAGSQRGESRPGTGSLHPVAIGAVVEATKLLKPPV